MDAREKILKEFDQVINANEPTKASVFAFLRDLVHYTTGDPFIIGDKDDFVVKKVEGDTYFNPFGRVLYLGDLVEETRKYAFDALLNMMFYYQHVSDNPDDKTGFKRNDEKKLAYEFVAAAISEYFINEFCRPDPEIEALIQKYGLFNDLLVIQMFVKKYIKLIEFEGDLVKFIEKIKDTMTMFFETIDDNSEDASVLDALGSDASIEGSEQDQQELLKNLLENLSIE